MIELHVCSQTDSGCERCGGDAETLILSGGFLCCLACLAMGSRAVSLDLAEEEEVVDAR